MRAIALGMSLLLGGCAATQVLDVMHPTVTGSIELRIGSGPSLQWAADRCISGDLSYFMGFDFHSSQDAGLLRALVDPLEGAIIRWMPAPQSGLTPATLRAKDCTRLDLHVEPTAWHVNDVREYAGHLDLSCDAADGTHIEGHLAVDHCH